MVAGRPYLSGDLGKPAKEKETAVTMCIHSCHTPGLVPAPGPLCFYCVPLSLEDVIIVGFTTAVQRPLNHIRRQRLGCGVPVA